MKALRVISWIIISIAFGAIAGLVIAAVTVAAGALMLRDAILSWCNHPSALRREKPSALRREKPNSTFHNPQS